VTTPDGCINEGLQALEERARRELSCLQLPARPWMPAGRKTEGNTAPDHDVVIVGAGMFGVAAAIALRLKGVDNLLLVDAAEAGREGPWRSYARMLTLRSPKDLPGPSMNIPSLTFRAWYEAIHGEAAWQALYKIPNGVWQAYLEWLVHFFTLPVRNETTVASLALDKEAVRLTLQGGGSLTARRVVLATGRNGTGGPSIPDFVDPALWPDLAAHSSEAIDFERLGGRHVAIIGAGASAWDNAATALEAGAGSVTIYARRTALPQINKARASTNPGYLVGWAALPPELKWQLLVYFDRSPAPPPHETVHRVLAHADRFELRLGTRFKSVTSRDGRVVLDLEGGRETADFVILGTGFAVDVAKTPMLAGLNGRIALWRDRYQPARERPHLGAYPWLGEGFEFQDKEPGSAGEIERIHLFSSASFAFVGFLSADIPGLTLAAERLASHVVEHLFREEFAAIKAELVAWDGEYELEGTPYLLRGAASSA
jgi:cation diffusion facilitator CzcD-associated flavoprotein CzcO